MRALHPRILQQSVLVVAPELLGCVLVRRFRGALVAGRICEVEAYRQDDPASHTYSGRTPRNEVMFGPGGMLYVYFTYGMHFCANVVTGKEGHGEAVLLRSVEPLVGLDIMARRRYGHDRITTRTELLNLTRGPARLCQAFHLNRTNNGIRLTEDEVFITKPWTRNAFRVKRSARVGIRSAREKRWRVFIDGSPWVSAGPSY